MSISTVAAVVSRTAPRADGKDAVTWPEVAAFGVLVLLLGILLAVGLDVWKTRRQVGQDRQLRELVNRYEQLAAATMDAQQRTAIDLAEVRARTAAIEQVLRTVE